MIHISNLNKTFGSSKGLSHINLHVAPGEMVALIGSSGSGKSTLMRHICGLTAADKGESLVRVDSEIVQKNGCISRDIRRIRAGIGMIFQQFNLVERMSVARNVMLGALARTSLWRSLTGAFHTDDKELALRALSRVGIGEKAWQRTGTLSGGQQQRAAIARALVQRARVLLADEPIASLDPESARNVMQTLRDLNQKDGLTVVVTLHQVDYAMRFCPRTVALKKGEIVYDGPTERLTPQFLAELYGAESDELFALSARRPALPSAHPDPFGSPFYPRRKYMFSRLLSGLLVSAMLLGSALTAQAQQTLNFGIMSTEASQNLKVLWDPFLKDMSKALGMEVKAFFASDYAGVIEGMRFKKVDLSWIGNKGAMVMVDRANGEVFAQTTAPDGSKGYYSCLIVNKKSPLQNLDDMFAQASKLSFSNGDPNSTSGFLVPGYYVFAKNGKDPQKIFARTVSANHEANALSVANNTVDVATCNNEGLARLAITAPEKAKELRVIWKSPLIPSDPLVWRKDLPDETKKKITDFIFSYGVKGENVEQARKILTALKWGPFIKSDNSQLIPLRQLELFRAKTVLEGNKDMDAKEKAAKIAEIERKLAKLGK